MSAAAVRRRRRQDRALSRSDADGTRHALDVHGIDLRCPHCGRTRTFGELVDWSDDLDEQRAWWSDLGCMVDAAQKIGGVVGAGWAYCRRCRCFAAVGGHEHWVHADA